MDTMPTTSVRDLGWPSGKEVAPSKLPGTGLSQHDFFYAGENKVQNMYILRGGRIVWRYEVPDSRGEISDAQLLSNGDVLFAHQFGVTLIAADHRVRWHRAAPEGREIHTAQMIGTSHVLYVQNADPAEVIVENLLEGKVVRRFTLPVRFPTEIHTQFRRARLTEEGTLLVAHWDLGLTCEYDETGRCLKSTNTPGVWAAQKLSNSNILFCASHIVREVDSRGQTIWEFTPQDVPDYLVTEFQVATRLPNGNTLVNNWCNPWRCNLPLSDLPVQIWEVNPQKKVVWALRSWSGPNDLGPATVIQLLDDPSSPEDVHFGSIR